MAIKADGTIIINTKIDTDGIDDGLKDIEKESSGASKGLGDVFGQMFGASALADIAIDALREVGQALKELAVESIEAAADIRAENAQFAETFKELEDTASDSLNKIAKDVGISATRMKKSYTKSFAFVKSIGADSEEAMNIANRAMVAAADSAAYYDVTVEEATETLQSFLKGNYENDAALGIAATETTRNAKANELYAMSFDKLSESQKVDVLLAMVEAGNAASGAMGQAAREADSWTNVTGELQESWRQLLGVLGDPLLEALTPILQGVSNSIYGIIQNSDAQKLRENFNGYAEAVAEAQSAFDASAESIDTAAAKAGFCASRLEALEQAGLDTAVAQEEYKLVVQELNDLIPGLNLVIDEQTGIINKNTDEIRVNIDAWKKQATAQALQQRFADVLKAQGEAEADLNIALAKQNNLSEQAKDLEKQRSDIMEKRNSILDEMKVLQDELAKSTSLTAEEQQVLSDKIEELYWQSDALGMEYGELGIQLDETRQQEEALGTEIDRANGIISELTPSIQEAADAMDHFNATSGQTGTEVPQDQEQVQAAIQGTVDTVGKLRDEYNSAKTAARESIDSQIDIFAELKLSSDTTASGIIKNWESQREAFDNYSANLKKAVDMGLDEALVQQLSDGSKESMEILQALVNDTGTNITEINAAFAKVDESRTTAASSMAAVQTDMNDRLTDIKDSAEGKWGEMATDVAEAINEMQVYINSLTGKTVFINVVQRTSASSPGSAAEADAAAAISSYDMPHLAKGAVIPPKSPFMAVLGDQQRGVNIEAPLATIQEAVRAETAGMLSLLDQRLAELLEENRALRSTVESVDLGDETIGAAAGRYNSRLAVMRGG